MSRLPRPEDFSKALYTLDIGQNDLHAGIKSMTEKQMLESIPSIIIHFAHAVEVTSICLSTVLYVHFWSLGEKNVLDLDLTKRKLSICSCFNFGHLMQHFLKNICGNAVHIVYLLVTTLYCILLASIA